MLTIEEKQEWIIKNCLNEKHKFIDLSGLDLSDYTVNTSDMKANILFQSRQEAKTIIQNCHKADLVEQSGHKARNVMQGGHKANCINQSYHEACYIEQIKNKAERINQEHNYAKELRTTDLNKYEKKIDDYKQVYYVLKE